MCFYWVGRKLKWLWGGCSGSGCIARHLFFVCVAVSVGSCAGCENKEKERNELDCQSSRAATPICQPAHIYVYTYNIYIRMHCGHMREGFGGMFWPQRQSGQQARRLVSEDHLMRALTTLNCRFKYRISWPRANFSNESTNPMQRKTHIHQACNHSSTRLLHENPVGCRNNSTTAADAPAAFQPYCFWNSPAL